MKTPKQVIATALTEWIERNDKNGTPIANQIKLCHVPEGRPPSKVQSWVVNWPGTNLQDLTSTVLDTATDHAQNGKSATVEEYYIIPYFGAELEEGGHRRFTIRVVHETATDEGVGYTEGPTKAGMIHMDMRHLEERHRNVTDRESNFIGGVMEELKRLRLENKGLRDDLRMANDGLEAAKDRTLERKLSIFKANQEETRKDKVIDAIVPVGMMLANAAMGAPVFQTNSDDQSQQAILSFLSSMKVSQLKAIHAALDPQQQLFFDHMMEQIKKMKQLEHAEKQKQAEAKVNGVEQDPQTMKTLSKNNPSNGEVSP